MSIPRHVEPGQRPARFIDPRRHGLRGTADRFIHHPATELGVIFLIVVSVLLILAEHALSDDLPLQAWVAWAADAVTWIFVLELSIRFWVAGRKGRFFRRYWLDILAILPLIRPLRLFRVVRLLRLFRAGLLLNRRLSIFRGVFRGAGTELTVLLTVTTILVLASAVTLHLGERAVNPDFVRLGGTLWFSLYSLVGGEPIGGLPNTELGRVVTLLLMLGGLTVFGMFVGTISAAMGPRLSRRLELNEMDLDELSNHIVICGWNSSGRVVLSELFSARERRAVVVITEGEQLPADPGELQVPRELLYHVQGDFTRVEVLEMAGVPKAAICILLSDDTRPRSKQDRDARTVLGALTAERLAHGIFTCAELQDRQNETLLRRAGVEEIVVADEYGGFIIGSVGRTRGLVATLDEIFTVRSGNAFFKSQVPAKLQGMKVGDLHDLLKRTHQATLVSVECRDPDEHGPRVIVNPPADHKVHAGDSLVVIAKDPVKW